MTDLLRRWASGDRQAFDQATSLVYDELKRVAHGRLRGEASSHTLNTTGLVHEAYLKLAGIQRVAWSGRNHFLSMASRVMRRILVDHACRRNAAKRGGGREVTLEEEHLVVSAEEADRVLELDRALERLEATHPRPARVVELYYFGGLPQVDVGEVLGVSQPTVARDLRFALAWLGCEWARP